MANRQQGAAAQEVSASQQSKRPTAMQRAHCMHSARAAACAHLEGLDDPVFCARGDGRPVRAREVERRDDGRHEKRGTRRHEGVTREKIAHGAVVWQHARVRHRVLCARYHSQCKACIDARRTASKGKCAARATVPRHHNIRPTHYLHMARNNCNDNAEICACSPP